MDGAWLSNRFTVYHPRLGALLSWRIPHVRPLRPQLPLFKKDLFEEEANHPWSAAIQGLPIRPYNPSTKPATLAATAVSRLGEISSAGPDNEAHHPYERILRDFSDPIHTPPPEPP